MHCKYAFEPTIYHRYNNVCSKCCRDDDGFPHCQVNTAPVGHGIPLGCLSRSPGPEGTTQRGPYRTAQPPYHAICHIKGGNKWKRPQRHRETDWSFGLYYQRFNGIIYQLFFIWSHTWSEKCNIHKRKAFAYRHSGKN